MTTISDIVRVGPAPVDILSAKKIKLLQQGRGVEETPREDVNSADFA